MDTLLTRRASKVSAECESKGFKWTKEETTLWEWHQRIQVKAAARPATFTDLHLSMWPLTGSLLPLWFWDLLLYCTSDGPHSQRGTFHCGPNDYITAPHAKHKTHTFTQIKRRRVQSRNRTRGQSGSFFKPQNVLMGWERHPLRSANTRKYFVL